MKVLLILNGPAYGDEKGYNALRLAHALSKTGSALDLVVFLMADAVGCAKAGQKTPDGYYNLGVAHGVPGIIGLLAQVIAAGVAVNLLDRTLETERRMDELCDWSDPVVLASAVPRRVVVKESFAAGVSLWTVRGHRGADEVCVAAEGLYEEAVVQRAR